MTQTELFLSALLLLFSVPYLIWRLFKTDLYAPLVVVQIVMGVILGPGVLGALFPEYYNTLFSDTVIHTLNGIAWWAVMLFVFVAGLELDLHKVWQHRYESAITASLALGAPLLCGALVALLFFLDLDWVGPKAQTWQFILGVGMSCAVTALPILILFMEKLQIFRQRLGQRILRYASLDDLAIWAVLAIILLDWTRMGRQLSFFLVFVALTFGVRFVMQKISKSDCWYLALIWLISVALASDWAGLHFMVGAFLAGVVLDNHWFEDENGSTRPIDNMRHYVLLLMMPVFFISTGLKTQWTMGGGTVLMAAVVLLFACVVGKLIGLFCAAKILKWQKGEAWLIAWLLQTKALIMIIFANILLDKNIITHNMFTALLLMAVFSTMLTMPLASGSPLVRRKIKCE